MSASVAWPDILQACSPSLHCTQLTFGPRNFYLWSHACVRPPRCCTQRRQDSGMSLWGSGALALHAGTSWCTSSSRLCVYQQSEIHPVLLLSFFGLRSWRPGSFAETYHLSSNIRKRPTDAQLSLNQRKSINLEVFGSNQGPFQLSPPTPMTPPPTSWIK